GLGDAPGLASAPAPALASLGALDPDLGTRFQRSRGEPAMQIAQAFTAAVIAAAGERPLLLVVDDAQWLDALSLALLPALARVAHARAYADRFAAGDPAARRGRRGVPAVQRAAARGPARARRGGGVGGSGRRDAPRARDRPRARLRCPSPRRARVGALAQRR